jgi:hypothetical protein
MVHEGTVRLYVEVRSGSSGICDETATIHFRLVYSTALPGGGCSSAGEMEMAEIRDQIGDLGEIGGGGGSPLDRREGWVFNHSQYSAFPPDCSTPLVAYRPRNPVTGKCSEVEWNWHCGFPCALTFVPLSVQQCYSAGVIEISAMIYENPPRQMNESLYVMWTIQGDANTCNCSCTAEVKMAETEVPGEAPYFGPHYIEQGGRAVEAPDPTDCRE